MSAPPPAAAHGAARLDRWLFAVRLFRSRTLAAQAASGGRVHVNGARVKPAHEVRPGDQISLVRGAVEFECTVTAVPARRGPAPEAARCYAESAGERGAPRRLRHPAAARRGAHAATPASAPASTSARSCAACGVAFEPRRSPQSMSGRAPGCRLAPTPPLRLQAGSVPG